MAARVTSISVEVFCLEEVKNFALVKPMVWQGKVEEQQHLFDHIVGQFLWKHVRTLMTPNAKLVEKLTIFQNIFAVEIATMWPIMMKTFLKCVSVFGVLEPAEIFEGKTIAELLKLRYYFFDMQWKKDGRYDQVYELVDLVYFKTREALDDESFSARLSKINI